MSSRRSPKDILASFRLDTPYVTEVRRLLQSLWRRGQAEERKTFLITSASRGDGKSTTCALLAVVAARVFRKRVLVLDGDFRRPAMHHLLGVPHRPGLCEVIRGHVALEAAIRSTPLPTLRVLPSGSASGPLAEAYDDQEFERLLSRLRSEYDLVLVDSAPVVPVVEPLLMAEHVDGILVVAMAGKSALNLVRRMRKILGPVSSRIAGVILSNATEGLPYYYDYRYYGYEPQTRKRIRIRRHEPEADGPHHRATLGDR